MSKEILGKDLRLADEELGSDLTLGPTGDLETIEEEYNLSQAITNSLRTRRGELADLGHPNYGSRLYELIGEPNNERTRNLARIYATECIARDPRVQEIIDITVNTPKDDLHRIDIDITVLPVGSSTPLNIVFPFYLEVV
jgi:phage baseplate assembly protein W